jgi:cysteine desulfuration protein SufE
LIKDEFKTDSNVIKGCQSKYGCKEKNTMKNRFHRRQWRDYKRNYRILIRTFSNQTAKSILEADMGFIDAIGLKEHLSPTRANGLVSMIKNIKMYALAFESQN